MAEPLPPLNFPTEFPYECDSFASNSDLNSPVESVVSSTDSSEGSTEDDEFFLGLTQQLAWTSLCETEDSPFPCFNPNKSKLVKSGSPQSTLYGIDSWLSPYHKNSPFVRGFVGAPSSTNNLDYDLFSNLAYSSKVQQMRQGLVLQALYASSWGRRAEVGLSAQPNRKPEIQNRDVKFNVPRRCGGGTGGLYHSQRIPPPQNHPPPPIPSAIRRVHPGASAVKRASSGTGVFLPRRHVNSSDFRQKQSNPAIRFPEEMKTLTHAPFNGCLSPGFDSIIYRRNNPVEAMPRGGSQTQLPGNQELHHLPQEWTY